LIRLRYRREANEHLGFDADLRDYVVCKLMLDTLQVRNVEIMTNNPKKIQALTDMGEAAHENAHKDTDNFLVT
jgi:GTP cyclohydrolase II